MELKSINFCVAIASSFWLTRPRCLPSTTYAINFARRLNASLLLDLQRNSFTSGFLDPAERSEDSDHRTDPVHEGQPVLPDSRPDVQRLDPEADPGAGGRFWRLRMPGFVSRRRGEEAEDVLLVERTRYDFP